jgi:hypothetical protein
MMLYLIYGQCECGSVEAVVVVEGWSDGCLSCSLSESIVFYLLGVEKSTLVGVILHSGLRRMSERTFRT